MEHLTLLRNILHLCGSFDIFRGIFDMVRGIFSTSMEHLTLSVEYLAPPWII